MMKIDFDVIDKSNGTMPLYMQLRNLLRGAILSGVYEPGEKLDSERTIMANSQLSYPTVSRALQELADEGLICKKHGSGNFVPKSGDYKNTSLKRIALCYFNTETPYFRRLYKGVQDECMVRNIEVVAIATGLSYQSEITALDKSFKKGEFDAILGIPLSSTKLNMQLSKFQNHGLPMVSVGSYYGQIPTDTVTFDYESGGCEVAVHLLSQGITHIVHIGWKPHFPFNKIHYAMQTGIQQAIKQFSPGTSKYDFFLLPFGFEGEDDKIWQDLLPLIKPHGKTALVCDADILAKNAAKLLFRNKISVPDEIMISGAGNLPEYVNNPEIQLTTINWPLERAGREAIKILVERQRNNPSYSIERILDVQLIIRDSSTRSSVFPAESEKALLY